MCEALPKKYFDKLEFMSLQDHYPQSQRVPWTFVYGTARTVVWKDGEGDLASYPISLQLTCPNLC